METRSIELPRFLQLLSKWGTASYAADGTLYATDPYNGILYSTESGKYKELKQFDGQCGDPWADRDRTLWIPNHRGNLWVRRAGEWDEEIVPTDKQLNAISGACELIVAVGDGGIFRRRAVGWELVSLSPPPPYYVVGVAVHRDRAYVVGNSGYLACFGDIEHVFEGLGTGNMHSIAVFQGSPYFVGAVNGERKLWRINGTELEPVRNIVSFSMATFGDSFLYVTDFENKDVARFDGNEWIPDYLSQVSPKSKDFKKRPTNKQINAQLKSFFSAVNSGRYNRASAIANRPVLPEEFHSILVDLDLQETAGAWSGEIRWDEPDDSEFEVILAHSGRDIDAYLVFGIAEGKKGFILKLDGFRFN